MSSKTKLAAIIRDNHEEHPRKNPERDATVARNEEDYNTQVLEVIEGRVTKTKKLS